MKIARIYVQKENLDKLSEETLEILRSGNLHQCIVFDNDKALLMQSFCVEQHFLHFFERFF